MAIGILGGQIMEREPSFGKLIKEHRHVLDLTQAELARRVGCATITLRKIEADSLRPSIQIAERLAMVLNIPLEERADFIRLARTQSPDTPIPPPTPTPPPLPEEIGEEDLSGRAVRGFQLGDRIGAGGFGVVYRATQPVVERDVAIKIILPQYANHPDFIRRFEAEAQLVARLEHPHIVPLYDFWREPNAAYLVMRLLRSGSLRDRLKGGPLPLEFVFQVLQQVGSALHSAHRFGVIHRDLKPANVLLDEDDNAYLADFGIAKNLGSPNLEDHTQTGAMVGSPAYVSPEQIRAESILPQADVYCLGVLLFEMLTGKQPFTGPTPIDLIMHHLNDPLPPLRQYLPELPEALEPIIQRATAKNPMQRYADVTGLMAAVQEVFVATQTGFPIMLESSEILFPNIDPAAIENPYKGLHPFGEADADDFFGRDTLIQELLGKMSEDHDLSRFLAVVGPSGSGKSSVVKAGLIPALRRGGLPGSENWFIVDFMPGTHPFEELEAALLRVAINPPESLLGQLREDQRGLLRAVRRALPADESVELVLVIDQFEEIFTLVADEQSRTHFLESLVTAVLDPHSRLRVILTLRADFTDRPLQYVDFGELMRQRVEFVLPQTPDELELVISGPARRAGLLVDPKLVSQIIRDLGDQPGTLPLLEYALTELFEHRDGQKLTLAAYEESSGVLGALGRRAEEIYTQLNAVHRQAARQLFLRLVALGEGTEDVRRRVLRSELATLSTGRGMQSAESSAQVSPAPLNSAIDPVIEQYAKYRLLTFDRDPTSRAPTVEVAHEALLREWSRLHNWLDESREDVRNQRVIAHATVEWLAAGRDSSFLLRGTRLDQFEDWAQDTDIALTQDELAFIGTSQEARVEREAIEAERQDHEQKLEQRSRQFLRALVGVFAVATVIAVMLSGVAFNQRGIAQENAATATFAQGEALQLAAAEATSAANAHDQQAIAEEQQAVAEEQARARATQQAIAEAEAAARAVAQAEAEAAEQDALRQASIGLASQAIQELNGNFPERAVPLALEALENYPYTWQAERALSQAVLDSRIRMIIPSEALYFYHDLSPDSTRLLSGRENGTVSAYDLSTGIELFRLTQGEPFAAAWSPDGSKILSISESSFQVWDASGNLQFERESKPDISRSGWQPWAPDGDRFVIGDQDGTARVFDAQTGEIQLLLEKYDSGPIYATWSPVGDLILTHYGGYNAVLWDAINGDPLFTFPENDSYWPRGWSPSGRYLALDGEEMVHIYDIPSRKELFSRLGNLISKAAWSPDEKVLITMSVYGGEAKAWDAISGDLLASITDLVQGWGVAWSPSGNLVAVGGVDGSVRVWDPLNDREILKLLGMSYEPRWIFWSPAGDRIIATGTSTSSILEYDLTTAELTIQGTPGVVATSWSPDGSQIASVYQDGTVTIYDAGTGKEIMNLDSGTDWGLPPRWSPDGDRLVTINIGGQIKIWDVLTGELFLELEGHNYIEPFNADWSPDGERLVTIDLDTDRIIVWDTQSGAQLLTFDEHPGGSGLAWSPDGSRIISTGFDGKALVWNADTGEVLLELFPEGYTDWVAGAEWSHDGSKIAVFDGNRFGHIFDAQTGDELAQLCCQDSAWQITWSPTDERIFTTGGDGTAKVWDVATGVELIVYNVGGFPSGEFSPDGMKVLIATSDGTTRLYPVWQTAQELIDYAQECCLVRELTPDEREQFGLPEKP
jgi:serine/threonine protein kinase/WD40 repeat protein/DNA-binding XRE family transcriptional regulator